MRSPNSGNFILTLEKRKIPSPLSAINYKAFLIPALILLIGALIWILALIFWPTNLALIVFGQVIFAIGLFVAILLGFWVMTLIRLPQDR